MVIRYSNQLLEQLSELEEKISLIEKVLEDLDLEFDKELMLRNLLTRKFKLPGQKE
jgi:hypothetical protein